MFKSTKLSHSTTLAAQNRSEAASTCSKCSPSKDVISAADAAVGKFVYSLQHSAVYLYSAVKGKLKYETALTASVLKKKIKNTQKVEQNTF